MTDKFNVENYLNSLPQNIFFYTPFWNYFIIEISLDFKRLTYLPNLSRFTCLKSLNICYNNLTSLPELPKSLEELYCRHNQLTFLPELPESLIYLHCSDNQLTFLPELPKSIKYLNCAYNQLTFLPKLPENLRHIICYNNQLTFLPELPKINLRLNFENNIIYEIVYDLNIEIIKKNIKIINKFRKLHYFIKIKYWLYKYVLKYVIEKKYHPENLIKLLTANNDLENILKDW